MKWIARLLSWLISLSVPYLLIMVAVRLLISPFFLQFEYNRPGFPPDTYGFTLEDRLKWGNLSVQYLLNDADLSFLGDLKLEDGSPLYNERELSHMLDVKVLIQRTLRIFYLSLALIVGLGLWAWRTKWLEDYWNGLSRGGWLTVGLIVGILLLVLVSFRELFTVFHRIFFTGDTWIFLYSDSLIRLFPLQFWQDAFVLMGIFTLAGGLFFGFIGKRLAKQVILSERIEQMRTPLPLS